MNKELIIRSNSSAVDFALLNEGKLIELNKETDDNKFSVGDIFFARVKKPISGLNAAFVNIGHEKNGFLHYHDLGPQLLSLLKYLKVINSAKIKNYMLNNFEKEKDIEKNGKISDLLKPNQFILVQIIKEPISTKGPRVSCEISLAGRYMVLIPFSERVSISQKIESNEERTRLKRLVNSIKPKNFGVIVRTVAKQKKVAELDSDLQNLVNRWEKLCKNIRNINKCPSKVLGEINRTSSILRDIFDDSFKGIYVDDKFLLQEVKEYLDSIAPKKKEIVNLYKDSMPIFEKFGIERQIKTSFGKTVSMKKGAYLVIEHTEALHVIDVNSGNRSNKEKSQEDTAFEVNMISATEIARQLRLRDMGGIIVIDFIDLSSSENRKKLFEHLKEEMSKDRTKHKILPPSKFGLIQITRQRVRPELNIKTLEPNPNQTSEVEAPIVLIDKIKSDLNSILNHSKHKKRNIYLHVHPFVAAYLTQGIASIKFKWWIKFKRRINIIPRDAYQYLQYKFRDEKNRSIRI